MQTIKTARKGLQAFTCLCLFIFGCVVQAQEIPASGTFSFDIENVTEDPRGLASIAVELDNYDVSLFVELSPGLVQLSLPTPLESGEHQLIIQAFFANGDIELLLEKSLTVIETNKTQGDYSISLDQGYRAYDRPDDGFSEVDRSNTNGAAVLSGSIEQDKWQLSSQLETLYDSEQSNTASGDEFDLPFYQIEARHKGDMLQSFMRLGDHSIDQQSLMFSGYQRRGLTAGVASSDGQYQVQMFAYHSDPSASAHQNLAYPNNQKEQSTGAIVSYSPFQQTELLTIETAYLEGEGSTSGVGFQNLYEEDVIYGGDNWNLTLNSQLFDQALTLKSEYAWSNFDSDGLDIGEGRQRDAAWNASAQWHAAHSSQRFWFEEWTLGAQVQEVGTEYWSLGNLYLPGDLYTEKIYYAATTGGLNLASEFIREQNNIDQRSDRPDQEAEYLNIDWYYTPLDLNQESPLWSVVGLPSFNGYAHYMQRTQDAEDALLAGYDLDNFVSEYNLSANFSKATWNWSIQHTQTWLDDRSDVVEDNGFLLYEPPSDSINYLTGLTLGLNPSESMLLNFLIQWNVLKEEQSRNKFSNLNFGIDSQFLLIPEKWTLNLNYSINENDNDYSDEFNINSRFRDQSINLQSNWILLKAKGISPGVNLYFKGSYLRQQEIKTDENAEIYQLLLGFSLYWNKEGHQQ